MKATPQSILMLATMTLAGLFFGLVLLLAVARPDVYQAAWKALSGQTVASAPDEADRPRPAAPSENEGSDRDAEPFPEADLTGTSWVEEEPLEPTDEEIEAAIDRVAGHPDDPALPFGTLGSSDEVLRSIPSVDIQEFLEDPYVVDFVNRRRDEPRFTFAIGRAAMFHGYLTHARRHLEEAAERGSGPAAAYLADPAFTPDPTEAERLLEKALALGFEPAASLLEELRAEAAAEDAVEDIAADSLPAPHKLEFDLEVFQRSDLIGALHRGDVAALDQFGVRNTVIYLSSMQKALVDPSVLIHLDPAVAPTYRRLLDPTLSSKLAMLAYSDSQLIDDQMKITTETLGNFMKAYAKIGKGPAPRGAKDGGFAALMKESAGSYAALVEPAANYEAFVAQAAYDAFTLALMTSGSPEDVKRVVDGMKAYVAHRGQ
ncbi:MAG: hypothetical protein AAF488_11320 [Planctomycetota bacterium]